MWFWSTDIQLYSPAAFVHYAGWDPDVFYEMLHNTLNSAKRMGSTAPSSPSSNLSQAGTGKGTEEQGWAGQGSWYSVQSFGRTWVRYTRCHPSLNKGSGKTAVDLMGPEFLSLYISSSAHLPGMTVQLLLQHSPGLPVLLYHTASGDTTER